MKQNIFTVKQNKEIQKGIFEMLLSGDTSEIVSPGQFVNIALSGGFLRRPISVCDKTEDELKIIFRVVGKGTEELSKKIPGEKLDILSGLGNGYDTKISGDFPVLIGGGVGVPPLYMLAKKLISENKKVKVILGFNDENGIFYVDEFKKIGAEVYVSTVDGSVGTKGFVTDVLKNLDYSFFYACGPEVMFRAIDKVAKTSGQYSFEARMGCGFGACMGCSCKTLTGNKRICKEGPVMMREEIIWEN